MDENEYHLSTLYLLVGELQLCDRRYWQTLRKRMQITVT
jgi:hypothetical protein